MTAVQLVLFSVAAVQERASTGRSGFSAPVVQAAVIQEEEGTVSFEPMTPPPAVKAAAILNFPAMIGGVLLAGVFHRETDASIIGFSVLFVPLVWYPIGRWVDRQIAGVPAARKAIASHVARWSLRVLAILGLIACLFSARGGFEGPDNFSYIPIGLWSTSYLFCSFRGDHRLSSLHLGDISNGAQKD
jgi:hypothetical protein